MLSPRLPRVRVQFNTEGESRTKQSMQAECEINTILRRYRKTGVINHINRYQGQYGDFTDTPVDFQTALQIVQDAEQMFSTLPSEVRKKFANDPGAFVDFVANPENHDELVKLGLANPRAEAPAGAAAPSTPPASAGSPPAAPPTGAPPAGG